MTEGLDAYQPDVSDRPKRIGQLKAKIGYLGILPGIISVAEGRSLWTGILGLGVAVEGLYVAWEGNTMISDYENLEGLHEIALEREAMKLKSNPREV